MDTKMLKDVLKQARLATNLKQSEVAEQMGVTPQTYLKWENGRSEPKISQVGKLSDILKVSVDEICRGEVFSNEADPLVFMRKIAVLKNALDEVTFTSTLAEYINDQIGFIEKLEKELKANDEALQKAEYDYAMRQVWADQHEAEYEAQKEAHEQIIQEQEEAKESAWAEIEKYS